MIYACPSSIRRELFSIIRAILAVDLYTYQDDCVSPQWVWCAHYNKKNYKKKPCFDVAIKTLEEDTVRDEANLITTSELSNMQFNALIRVSGVAQSVALN